MNDFTPLSDEALSAYLDGEATPDEVARIEADPSLQAELDSLRAVATATGTLEMPSDDVMFSLRAKAINGPDIFNTPVVDLNQERTRRRARFAKFGAAIAVAAAVVVAALVAPNLNSSDTDTVASDATTAEDSADDSAADAAMAQMDAAEESTDYSTDDSNELSAADAESYGDDDANAAPEAAVAQDEATNSGDDGSSASTIAPTGRAAFILPDVIEALSEPIADKVAEQLALLGEPILFYTAEDLATSPDEATLNEVFVCADSIAAERANGEFLGGGSLINADSDEVEYVILRNADGVVQVVTYIAPECVANPIIIEP